MDERKKSSRGKGLLIGSALALTGALVYVGEQTTPVHHLKEKIAFHNVGPAPSTPDNYRSWRLVVEKNTDLDAIVKITDDSITYILDKDLGPTTIEKQQDYWAVKQQAPAPGTPQDFLHADFKYQRNAQGLVELYFGNKQTEQYWRVHENWTAGSVGEQIDDFFEKLLQKANSNVSDWQKVLQNKDAPLDSLLQAKKQDYLQTDIAKQNFWQRLKENVSESYEELKEKF